MEQGQSACTQMDDWAALSAGGACVTLRSEGSDKNIACVLRDIGHGRVHLYAGEMIMPETRVVVAFEQFTMNGEVKYCTSRGNLYTVSVDVTTTPASQRREPRFPVDIPGKVILMSDSGTMAFRGVITDFSRSGLGLTVPVAVEVGSIACIETATMLVVGEVRHCRTEGEGRFVAGLAMSDVLMGNAVVKIAPKPFLGVLLDRAKGALRQSTRFLSNASRGSQR